MLIFQGFLAFLKNFKRKKRFLKQKNLHKKKMACVFNKVLALSPPKLLKNMGIKVNQQDIMILFYR